jgi:CBS domain containing-hemolysin-like protein
MVTWEDLLEELFGELRDEFDEAEEPLLSPLGNNTYMVRGETPISYLNSKFGLALPGVQVHSVGGLIISRLNRIPQVGDEIEIDGLQMRVETMQTRAVETVLLRLPETVSGKEGTN